jgi:hypothetical protein
MTTAEPSHHHVCHVCLSPVDTWDTLLGFLGLKRDERDTRGKSTENTLFHKIFVSCARVYHVRHVCLASGGAR